MHLIVIADAARARFLSGDTELSSLTEVSDHINPAARVRTDALWTDQGGRAQGHTLSPRTERHQVEEDQFARATMDEVRRLLVGYERLIIAAAPRFLGLLRKYLGDAERKLVGTVARDFSTVPRHRMSDAILRHLSPVAGMP